MIECGVSTDRAPSRQATSRGTVLTPCRCSPSTQARARSSCGSSATTTSCSRHELAASPPGGLTPCSCARRSTACVARTRSPIAWSTAARGSPDPCGSTAEVTEALRDLTPLAPLHQPAALDAMAAVSAVLPDRPAVACLDTAFHSHLPDAAATYALPREWRERHSLRRFGFHGLSHAYASRRAAELLDRRPGSYGWSAATSAPAPRWLRWKGAAPSTRRWASHRSRASSWRHAPGSVDPGLLLWLLQHGGLERRRGVGRAGASIGAARARRHRRHAGGPRRRSRG